MKLVMTTAVSLAFFAFGLLLLRLGRPGSLSRWFAAAMAFLVVLLSGIYFVIDALSGNGIDESVVYHLFYGLRGAGFLEFKGSLAAAGVTLAFCVAGSLLTYRLLAPPPDRVGDKRLRWPAYTALVTAFVVHPVVLDIGQLDPGRPGADDADFYLYFESPRVKSAANSKPNIVYIYAEGLERTYFDQARFPGLIKNLRRLEKQSQSFTNLGQVVGTNWTIAGMTASQCGIPLVVNRNVSARLDRFLPGAVCLGDILQENGYHLSYLGGASLEFAGKGKFYRTHGFSDVRGREELINELDDPAYTTHWGLFDDSLFDLARREFKQRSSAGKPFGLFMLTLDTHHPNGHPSRSCDAVAYGDGANPILNAVACSDYLIGEFVDDLLESEHARDTVVVVASDHWSLPNTATRILESGERRNLFMAIAPGRLQPGQNSAPGSTLDVAPTLLDLLGYESTGFGLGRSLLRNEPRLVEQFENPSRSLARWKHRLASFLETPLEVTEVTAIDGSTGKLEFGVRGIQAPVLLEFDASLTTTEVLFGDDGERLPDHLQRRGAASAFLWVDECASVRSLDTELPAHGTCMFAGRLGFDSAIYRTVQGRVEISPDDLRRSIDGSFSRTTLARQIAGLALGGNQFTEYALDLPVPASEPVLLRSFGGPGAFSGVMESDDNAVSNVQLKLERGITLLGLANDAGVTQLAHRDPCAENETGYHGESFVRATEENKDHYAAFAVVTHDSAYCGPYDLGSVFAGLPLDSWRRIQYRQPYIGVFSADAKQRREILGRPGLGVGLRLHLGRKSDKQIADFQAGSRCEYPAQQRAAC